MSETLEIRPKEFKMVDGHAVKEPEDYQDPELLYQSLIKRIREYHPSADISMIREGIPDCKAGSRRTEEEVRRALHHPSTLGRNHSGRA